jgi:polysaccharide pyruvyl transferase WcaK-like protein
MKYVLVGNYGIGNIGDEALKEYFLSTFKDVEWVVISGRPKAKNEVYRLPLGLRSFFTPWWQTIGAVWKSDGVVFGGGSLFTDTESGWACVIWWSYAFVARLLGRPYFMAFQGVGPFRKSRWKKLSKSVFEKAAFVSVRDENSLKRVGEWKLKTPAVLTFDAAFARFAQQSKASSSSKRLLIIPRTNSDAAFFSLVQSKVKEGFTDIRLLLMEPNAEEKHLAKRLADSLGVPSTIIDVMSVEQLLTEVAQGAEVVTQRFHGALAGLAVGIPVIIGSQAPGDKLSTLDALIKAGSAKERLLDLIGSGERSLRSVLQKS